MDSAGAKPTVNITVPDFEKIMAALTRFGSTLETHGQALTNQQEALTSHAMLLQQYGQSIQQLVMQTSSARALDPDPQPASDPTPPTPGPEQQLPAQQRYDGKPGK